jgi:hypothetical protein
MSRTAKIIYALAGILCLAMFLLPIIGMALHSYAVNQAQRDYEASQKRHEAEVRRIIQDSHDRGKR